MPESRKQPRGHAMTAELGIVFLHHATDAVTRNNLARIRAEHPGATIVTVSAGEPLPGGYALRDTPELEPYHAFNKKQGADWLVCSWFKRRRESCRRWWIVEWDVYCAMPVAEYYRPVWEYPFVASSVRRRNLDPTGWLWRDNQRLPPEFRPYAMGAVPFAYLLQEPALAAICSTLIAHPFAEGNGELRFGTAANRCGFTPCGFSPPGDQIGWVAHATIPNRRGIYHPVKFIPDFSVTPPAASADRGEAGPAAAPGRRPARAKTRGAPPPTQAKAELGILFLHHEDNEVVRNNLASIRRHHPDARIVTMSAAAPLPGGYSLEGTPDLKPFHAADPTQGADWLVCSWFLQRRESARKWWIVEWDVFCTQPAQEHYRAVWDQPFVATAMRLRHRDPNWFYFQSRKGIPAEFEGHLQGAVPFLYLLDETALERIGAILMRQPFTGGNCELRFASAGSLGGFPPCGFCPPGNQIGWVPLRRLALPRGIFHPVKFLANHAAVAGLLPGETYLGPPEAPAPAAAPGRGPPPNAEGPAARAALARGRGPARGILYLNTGSGPRRAELLRNSLRSLAATNPLIPFHVLTDVPTDFPFTWVDSLPGQRSREIKTALHRFTPFDLTLFLDDDTVLARPIELEGMIGDAELAMSRDLFGTLGEAAALSRLPGEYVTAREVEETMAQCGPDFPMFNSGVLLFRERKKVRAFFERWHGEWAKHRACDQFALARALHATGIKVKELPATYNQPISRKGILGRLGIDLSGLPIIENFPVVAGFAVPPEAHIYHLLAKRIVAKPTGLWQPFQAGPMETAFFRAVDLGQMSRAQYGYLAREFISARPCSLLMVGSGYDAELWWQCTQGNATYVEDNPAYLSMIPGKAVSFRYLTKVGIPADRIEMPVGIDRAWDFVLVDGPSGFDETLAWPRVADRLGGQIGSESGFCPRLRPAVGTPTLRPIPRPAQPNNTSRRSDRPEVGRLPPAKCANLTRWVVGRGKGPLGDRIW